MWAMEELLVETSDRLILCTNYINTICEKREKVNAVLSFCYKEDKNTVILLLKYAACANQLVHNDKMAKTSGKNKQMENFMGTKVFVQLIENRKFAGINNSAQGVNDATNQQPDKSRGRHQRNNIREGKNTEPAHGNIEHRGDPFRTIDKEDALQDAKQSHAPHKEK